METKQTWTLQRCLRRILSKKKTQTQQQKYKAVFLLCEYLGELESEETGEKYDHRVDFFKQIAKQCEGGYCIRLISEDNGARLHDEPEAATHFPGELEAETDSPGEPEAKTDFPGDPSVEDFISQIDINEMVLHNDTPQPPLSPSPKSTCELSLQIVQGPATMACAEHTEKGADKELESFDGPLRETGESIQLDHKCDGPSSTGQS